MQRQYVERSTYSSKNKKLYQYIFTFTSHELAELGWWKAHNNIKWIRQGGGVILWCPPDTSLQQHSLIIV